MSDMLMGFLNINKPLHLTSHDVVNKIRKIFKGDTGSKKVGHAGTLDPLATGVLIICLGDATRLSDYVMHTSKKYRAQITLGKTTDTYDAEGEILTQVDASHISREDVQAILPQFTGDIQQIPPMYSAIKVDGQKLYDMAREGKSIELKARKIHISSLEIKLWSAPIFNLDVACSSGTYVRSLAYDIGQALGVGAYLSGLVRLASGSFDIEDAHNLDTLLNDDHWLEHVISPYQALHDKPSIVLSPDDLDKIRRGQFIRLDTVPSADTLFAYTEKQDLAAILSPRDNLWKPHKVFLPQN